MTSAPESFSQNVPPELLQPMVTSPVSSSAATEGLSPTSSIESIATEAFNPQTTAATKINALTSSIGKFSLEIAPGILTIGGMIWLYRKVYEHTLGDILS